jgi:hypothetical protein
MAEFECDKADSGKFVVPATLSAAKEIFRSRRCQPEWQIGHENLILAIRIL